MVHQCLVIHQDPLHVVCEHPLYGVQFHLWPVVTGVRVDDEVVYHFLLFSLKLVIDCLNELCEGVVLDQLVLVEFMVAGRALVLSVYHFVYALLAKVMSTDSDMSIIELLKAYRTLEVVRHYVVQGYLHLTVIPAALSHHYRLW